MCSAVRPKAFISSQGAPDSPYLSSTPTISTRTGRPRNKQAQGPDGIGRVVGAWTFAARPAALDVRVQDAEPRIELSSEIAVVFGDDRVRCRLNGIVRVDRTRVGGFTFTLPGGTKSPTM